MPNKSKPNCGRKATEATQNSGLSTSNRISDEEISSFLSKFFKAKKLKQSEVRDRIIGVVLKEPAHFRVSDIVRKASKGKTQFGAATTYRTIKLLVEAGVLHEVLTGEDGETIFEVASADHHDHIVCLDCGKIFEFHSDKIEQQQNEISESLNFKPQHHRHVIYANCSLLKKP